MRLAAATGRRSSDIFASALPAEQGGKCLCVIRPRNRRSETKGRAMHNIIEGFNAPTSEKSDEGLVAIEYVVGAGLVAAGVAVVFTTGLWSAMNAKLTSLFS
jgi:hypothetical protein